MRLAFDCGGSGGPLLVLLHGLGATRQVWRPMLEHASEHWNGSWIAPDLRGHGVSEATSNYALGFHGADIAELVLESGSWRKVVVLGHSMGGAVALALASGWFGFAPTRVFGLGIKVAWSAEELAKLREFAATAPGTFADQDEAVTRYLKISGLAGLVPPDSEIAQAGVTEEDGAWRLAAIPATASVDAPPMQGLLAGAQCPIHLARGETDALVTLEQLHAYDPNAVNIVGTGHNAMVEKPDAVWAWLMSKPG
jgi:pimeloyl-ACP methyl ester carboxylesterase